MEIKVYNGGRMMAKKFKNIPELTELFKDFYMKLEIPLNDEKYTLEEKLKQLMACFYAIIEAIYKEQTPLFLNELQRMSLQIKLNREVNK